MMPRPDTHRPILLVVALCATVAAMAADRTDRATPPAAPVATTGGVAFAAHLGDAAVSLSWR
ncbi:hypothetical protein QLH51_17645 [Sphingomonas sp. 2R-10]|uniref:hypothetical protein n=1 Tax=Sphingomonas sp. 2R-10 TaxID=3045148 RepID=UPI000F795F80|nr:hypothetical protein [Sphingomonas sp. 2R-10]MDJ0278619.1 hypothetical protein [Sphingomonas sp. 2R-10]